MYKKTVRNDIFFKKNTLYWKFLLPAESNLMGVYNIT